MNIFISYFYNIRFFPTNLIPVSTAVYDPKWYHNFKANDYIFKDKRGVINGIRIEALSPYRIENVECKNCVSKDPSSCSFIRQYRDYIFSLDFSYVYNSLLDLSRKCNGADICLMVYEKPDNPCSERATLVEWFANNGVILMEFSKS
jgi:hypothetical protein